MINNLHEPITYVYLETTNFCNLECSFCNRNEVVKHAKHMSIDKWKFVLEKLKDHPIAEAKLMGLGEPFLHPKFSEICKIFKEYFPKAFVIVATNCQYKITDNFTNALKYIDLLYLSIDGYKNSYEKFRPPSKWDKLIKFLEELKKVNRFNCKITCNYVVNKENIEDIKHVNSLCRKYNLDELRLNIAQNWSENKSLNDEKKISGYSEEQVKYIKDNFKSNVKGKAPWTWSDCFWVKRGLYMTVDGDLKVCAINTDTASIGNIFVDDINSVLNSTRMKKIRTGCHSNKPEQHCKNCSYKELSPLLQKIFE
jgi:radical SAM protein with 4Fe4S-binding SPASM domain